VHITFEEQWDVIEASICDGDTYLFYDQELQTAGNYYHADGENFIRLDLTVFPLPAVSLGDDRTVEGLSTELDAGEGFASYLWSTGETSQKITVTGADDETVTLSVTATNTRDCQATAEVSITFALPAFTVSFDTQGGSAVVPQQVKEGGKVVRPAVDPARSGFSFGGWYKEALCINIWNFDTEIVAGDLTLYAKWNNVSVTNISDTERLEAMVYPNPVSSGKTFYIRIESGTSESTMVEIFNEIGQLLFKTQENADPIHLTAPDTVGSYFVRITNGKQTQTYKLVVE